MSEKQLNFLNIFETSDKKERSPLPEEESRSAFDENDHEDPTTFDLEEQRLREEAELISKKEGERAELELEQRQQLLYSSLPLRSSDFNIVLPEIKNYAERFRSYRARYQEARLEDKAALYPRLVWPDTYEEPEYRESARLYLNYLEVVKQERAAQQREDRAAAVALKKNKKKPVESASAKKEASMSKSFKDRDINKENDDAPDPYGDIYPYSRKWRR